MIRGTVLVDSSAIPKGILTKHFQRETLWREKSLWGEANLGEQSCLIKILHEASHSLDKSVNCESCQWSLFINYHQTEILKDLFNNVGEKWFKEILKDFSMAKKKKKVKQYKFDLSQTSLSWTKICHDHSHPDVI